ncbi:MAG: NAAT family transporter [Pseudolabrys sp.]|nr:NAAT family transporter [Pseudolabrys sp.]
MIAEAALASFIVALFSMMNPVGNVGIFAGLTADRPGAEQTRIAWTCAGAVAITLLFVAWSGAMLLELFGITVDSLRAAGGIIVLLIGLHMLANKSDHKGSSAELEDAKSRASVAVVPLAIPIVAGPGTMATVLVAAQQHPAVLSKLEISLAIVALAAFCGLLFSFAAPISKRLGESGMGVVTRVMGMVLAAIAMGMLADGLKGLLPGLAG